MFTVAVAMAAATVTAPSPRSVMNAGGVPYQISNPQGSTKDWKGVPGQYDTNFNTNAGPLETDFFDVYGEVQTKYSQVYWTRNAPVALPPALVERFKGKVMAITGYEVDQVTHSGPEKPVGNGDQLGGFSCYPSCSDGDKSVPIYHAYNHHYFGWLQGADSEMYTSDTPTKLPNPTYTKVRDLPHDHAYPTNIVFKENPGGEFRKSYHGYPAGYAQLLHSPTSWSVEPMQIDTHNRNYDINDQEGYKEWFLPQQDHNNMTNRNSGLSPLIECPCSDRITKIIEDAPTILTQGTCKTPIASLEECTAAVQAVVTVASSATISNTSEPSGCLIVPIGDETYRAVFNSAVDQQSCTPNDRGAFVWEGPTTGIVNCEGACLPPSADMECTGEFQGQCTWDNSTTALAMCAKSAACESFFCTNEFSDKLLCFARANADVIPGKGQVWTKKYLKANVLAGTSSTFVNLSITVDTTNANVTLTGPSSVWFGVGFNAQTMKDAPYAIIVDGTGAVTERRLVEHGPGIVLTNSVTVVSNTVQAGFRTVVLSRGVTGKTTQHYTIPTQPGDINIITAVGQSSTFSYHGPKRTGSKITLVPSDVTSCMCHPSSQSAFFSYMNQTKDAFSINCVDEPRGDMLRHGDGTGRDVENAACEAKTYHGGLRCCKNTWFLTDMEQDSMIPNKTDTYYLKWRYYFQDFTEETSTAPASHQHLHHFVFLIDADVNDYEEDNAHYGTNSIGKITAHLKMNQIGLEDVPSSFNGITPLVMTPHCHAPSCIRQEFWNADTGEIICNVTAKYGDLAYGSLDNVFNEANYIAIPPCIFGNQTGLQYPFTVNPDTNITAIKYLNNSYRHLGQMAQWTGLMVYN